VREQRHRSWSSFGDMYGEISVEFSSSVFMVTDSRAGRDRGDRVW
jgi:hypothetical protein